jgi:TRAP-type C4-dicarboxylate transport system substrate-binding protein
VAAGSSRNLGIEEPMAKLLEEKSNGRIKLMIYPSNTLAAQNEMLDALANGTADFGYLNGTSWAGQFLYTELFGTPGLQFGSVAEVDEILREYTERYLEDNWNVVKIFSRYSTGSMALVCNRNITGTEDFKGLTIRTTSNFMPFFEKLGTSCVSMSASEIYESIRLNVIDGAQSGISGIFNQNLAEVCDYGVYMPLCWGDSMICMSWEAYNALPADLQAVVDEVAVEMYEVITDYTVASEEEAVAYASDTNPDFQFINLSDEVLDEIGKSCAPLLEAKAAELDAAGLDGTGALHWLKSKSRNYGE